MRAVSMDAFQSKISCTRSPAISLEISLLMSFKPSHFATPHCYIPTQLPIHLVTYSQLELRDRIQRWLWATLQLFFLSQHTLSTRNVRTFVHAGIYRHCVDRERLQWKWLLCELTRIASLHCHGLWLCLEEQCRCILRLLTEVIACCCG